jgi:hypothetical protein
VKKQALSFILASILLVPVYANAQETEKITLFDTFRDYKKGEQIFIFGSLAQVVSDSFVIVQVINPDGDLCQIQQLKPLSNGLFLTDSVPLQGKICGISGEYEARIFYDDDDSTAKFSVTAQTVAQKTDKEYFDAGMQAISQKIDNAKSFAVPGSLDGFVSRLDLIKSSPSSYTISDLRTLYVELLAADTSKSDFDEIDPSYRIVVEAALDATAKLVESGTLSFDSARTIDGDTFAAVFYSKIGDGRTASKMLSDVFVSITNADPVKVDGTRPLSYVEIEETLLNIMKKTSSSIMSRPVKEEIAFIFSRGTGPLYVDDLGKLIDLLTKARFLDVVLEKNDPLYNLVNTKWGNLRESLVSKNTLDALLESKEQVGQIHEASLLLRQLDKVDRFISSESQENAQLASLIKPEWERLKAKLQESASADAILESRQEIGDMQNVIDISSRISKIVEISRQNNLSPSLITGWEELLTQVDQADTLSEILSVVSEFDNSIKTLREKRDPLSTLKFEYESMKKTAELQADYENLFLITNALKIIDLAEKEQDGISKVKADRLEVLLSWASLSARQIKTELDSYSKEEYGLRAADILQRAKSIENLVDLGLRTHRFLPGYTDFADSLKVKLNDARDLVIKNDLNGADKMVRELFAEWQQVAKAYETDPEGSPVGYSGDELQKIELRKKIDVLSQMSGEFYSSDFEPHSAEFVKLTKKAADLVEHGNYIDADLAIKEIREFLVQNLPSTHQKIIFNINYDAEKAIWIMQGFVDKPIFDRRERLYLTVYDMAGNVHSTLEFMDTKHGEVFTQWQAPSKAGLYVVTIQYQDAQASQILDVPEKTQVVLRGGDLENIDLAREFEEYQEFMEKFGGANYAASAVRFDPVISQIEIGLSQKDSNTVDNNLAELERLIERYLPVRSRYAVIDVQVDDKAVYVSGAVQKTLSFSEDLFVDIYDKKGNHIEEIELKDTASGHFNHVLTRALEPGLHVAQLQYHDLMVTDFFTIR